MYLSTDLFCCYKKPIQVALSYMIYLTQIIIAHKSLSASFFLKTPYTYWKISAAILPGLLRGCGISDIMTFAGVNYQLRNALSANILKKDILSSVGREESFVASLKD